MTRKEFYEAVANETAIPEVAEYASTQLAKLMPSAETLKLREDALALIGEVPQSAAEIGAQLGVAGSKLNYTLTQAAKAGTIKVGKALNAKGTGVVNVYSK